MAPFWSIDIQLSIVDHRLGITTWSLGELSQAWFGSLTSTDQKNGVRGEVIGFACSRDPYICSILALIRHITYLWTNSASPNTPPAPSSTTQLPHPNPKVTPAVIINQLRLVVHFFGPDLGFLPLGVLDWSLCAAGATALPITEVYTDIIRLLGRWRSDEMLCYLHSQAGPIMADYNLHMLQAECTLIPT